MPATAEIIGFALQDARIVTAGPLPAVEAKYGKAARDTSEPIRTFFDSMADVQVIADQRLALLSPDRRLFAQRIAGEDVALGLNPTGTTPAATVIDDDLAASLLCAIVEIGIDFDSGHSSFNLWG